MAYALDSNWQSQPVIPMRIHVQNKLVLVLLLCVVVGLAPTLMLIPLLSEKLFRLSGIYHKGILGKQAGALLLLWSRIPGLIFGEPTFQDSMFYGIAPKGFAGWLITVLFWAGVSVILWSLTLLFGRKTTRSGSISAE